MSDIKSGTIGRNTQQGEGEASSVAVNVEDIVNEIRAQLNGGGSVPTSGQTPARPDIRSIEKDDGEIELDIERIMDQIREEASAETASGFDIHGVMREIRQEADRHPAESVPDFSEAADALPPLASAPSAIPEPVQNSGRDFVFRQISNEANRLKATSIMPFYWDMGRGIKGLVKRVVRRLSRPMLMPILERQSEFNSHTANGVDALRMGLDEHARKIAALEGSPAIQILQQQVQKLNDALAIYGEMIASQGKTIASLSLSIARIRHHLAADSDLNEALCAALDNDAEGLNPSTEASKSENAYESLDYFQFQNYFRGTQTQIMERRREYLPYFRNRTGKIFDLGCGRGEFLRLLKAENIPAFGVDAYPEYEIIGQLYGIDIRVGDGLAALEQQQEPLGGIFCAQVIEHLGFKNVEKLCRLAYEKLEEGAYLVLETPNPMCVSTMTNGFYIDPTHDRPVHPLLMEYMLKSIGFTEVQLLWPDHSLTQLPRIKGDGIENLDEVNRAIERVSNLLFGSQDYAVIARK